MGNEKAFYPRLCIVISRHVRRYDNFRADQESGQGGAEVSEKHANFIINRGDATAVDVLALMQEIREGVYAKTGMLLESEIQYVPNI